MYAIGPGSAGWPGSMIGVADGTFLFFGEGYHFSLW